MTIQEQIKNLANQFERDLFNLHEQENCDMTMEEIFNQAMTIAQDEIRKTMEFDWD